MEPEPVNRNRLGSESIATGAGTESGQNRIGPKPTRNRNRTKTKYLVFAVLYFVCLAPGNEISIHERNASYNTTTLNYNEKTIYHAKLN